MEKDKKLIDEIFDGILQLFWDEQSLSLDLSNKELRANTSFSSSTSKDSNNNTIDNDNITREEELTKKVATYILTETNRLSSIVRQLHETLDERTEKAKFKFYENLAYSGALSKPLLDLTPINQDTLNFRRRNSISHVAPIASVGPMETASSSPSISSIDGTTLHESSIDPIYSTPRPNDTHILNNSTENEFIHIDEDFEHYAHSPLASKSHYTPSEADSMYGGSNTSNDDTDDELSLYPYGIGNRLQKIPTNKTSTSIDSTTDYEYDWSGTNRKLGNLHITDCTQCAKQYQIFNQHNHHSHNHSHDSLSQQSQKIRQTEQQQLRNQKLRHRQSMPLLTQSQISIRNFRDNITSFDEEMEEDEPTLTYNDISYSKTASSSTKLNSMSSNPSLRKPLYSNSKNRRTSNYFNLSTLPSSSSTPISLRKQRSSIELINSGRSSSMSSQSRRDSTNGPGYLAPTFSSMMSSKLNPVFGVNGQHGGRRTISNGGATSLGHYPHQNIHGLQRPPFQLGPTPVSPFSSISHLPLPSTLDNKSSTGNGSRVRSAAGSRMSAIFAPVEQ